MSVPGTLGTSKSRQNGEVPGLDADKTAQNDDKNAQIMPIPLIGPTECHIREKRPTELMDSRI
jgi:hypothetical protein